MEMVRIPEPPGMILNGIHGVPLEFCWNSVIVKNKSTTRNRTLASMRDHVSNQVGILTATLYDH